ncbi:unnamed protein product [Thlaspi arvense]|uniref:Neprosin PEP catalytic domain-containing protein n=1 Tax=Thlaspi arvense TaxID=13288 RepID=A0AAU9RC73_THLAR|nr:unnamed protein product [Thlaspi arvense]
MLCGVLLLLTLCGESTATSDLIPTPVLTIQSPDGDIIDCINRMDQSSLKNPLLKNHMFQEFLSHLVKTEEEGLGWQVWHASGTCPRGTIPMRRFETNSTHNKNNPLISDAADRATRGHKYAIAQIENQSFYGTKATFNVWTPVVESLDDFSLAQIWLVSGQYETNDLNTIEAGWQRDAYIGTGCYSTHCVGFVHISSIIAVEAAIAGTSIVGGNQFDITLQICKDPLSGNWWLGMGVDFVPIGYWPVEIFTTLSDHASRIQYGGEVLLYGNTSGVSTITQMGSGKFPDKGFGKSASFCNIQIAQENRTLLPLQNFNFTLGYTLRDSYTIKKAHNQACGTHFYYGGPGPVRSVSVRANRISFTCFVFVVLFVFVV